MPKINGMISIKASWRRILANGLLALALVASHALPLPAQSEASDSPVSHGAMTHRQMPGHDHHAPAVHKAVPAAVSCQACPGMALFLPEPLVLPARVAVNAYPPLASKLAEGRSPGLDTPPPRNGLHV
jgi:hypothetical protein